MQVCGDKLNKRDFCLVLRLVLVLETEELERIFASVDTAAKGKITYSKCANISIEITKIIINLI